VRNSLLTLLLLSALIIGACSANQVSEKPFADQVQVVATIYPLADLIRQLGGDRVMVTYLLPAGASPHTFEPTTDQARQVADARLFVYIGAGLDQWALKLAEAGTSDLVTLDLSAQVSLHQHDQYSHDYGNDHDHAGTTDPHFWLDPVLVKEQIMPALEAALADIMPNEKAYFSDRMVAYQEELDSLDREIDETTASFSKDSFISFHSAWQYFARRYDLHELAVVASFPGQEPSAGWVAELVEMIEEHEVGAILVEPQFSTALAESIADEAGIQVLTVDPLGGENSIGRQTYLDLMRYNLEVFREALQ
jgi:zinc transport system substrate-binding protein